MDKVNLDPDAFVFPDTEVYRVMNKLPNRLRRYPEGLYNFKNLGEQWIKPIARAAGVKVLSPHGMRHTFGTHLAMLDGQYKKEIVEIRDLMGHASLTSTQKYIHTAEMYRPNATDPLMIGMDFLESGMKIVKLARNGSNADQSFSRI
jgi:integrase